MTNKELIMSIEQTTQEPIKELLRTMKVVPSSMKAAILKGCKDQMAYVQFGKDLSLYNLWEALLYVQSYETDGYYTKGTAHNALEAWFSYIGQN